MKLHDELRREPLAVAFGMRRAGSQTLELARETESISLFSGGTAIEVPTASQSEAGVLGATDKAKLDTLSEAAGHKSLRTELAAADVPPEVLSTRVDGFAAAGDRGAGIYARRADPPPHEGKVQSADGAWWELAPGGQLRATQFGAVEGGDVTAAIQKAIDFAAYGETSGVARRSKPVEVLIDVHRGTLSDTIQVGYGDDFQTVIVRGLGQAYSNSDHHMGTYLTFGATDRPAFAINGGRDSGVFDLAIQGVARDGFNAIGNSGKSPTLEATWDAKLSAAGVTPGRRYAPYAGIVIDGYAGTRPGTSYPDVSCPSWINASFAQYGKKRGTASRVERVTIKGFEVAIAQSPADHDSNGDFPYMSHVRFEHNKYGFSTGNNQGRIPHFHACHFASVWTVYTNNVHGKQNGRSDALFAGCGFGGFTGRIFALGSTVNGAPHFHNSHWEALHRLGDVTSVATQSAPITFRDCTVNFRHSESNGYPSNVYDGGSTKCPVVLDGGEVRIGSVASFFNGRLKIVNGTMINFDDNSGSRAKAYGMRASNALAGGIVVAPGDDVPEFDCNFHAFDLTSGTAADSLKLSGATRKTGREYTVPLWSPGVQRAQASSGVNKVLRREVFKRPIVYCAQNRGSYAIPPSRSGRAISFTASQATTEQNAVQRGYHNGGVIRDTVTGTVIWLRSVDHTTGACVGELQNNYISDGAGGFDLFDTAFDPSTGVWDVIGTGVYLAPQPILGTTSTASADIAVAPMLDSPRAAYGLAVGDWLMEDAAPVQQTFSTPGRAKIASIASASGTITLGGNANATHAAPLSFDWWIVAEPASAASR